MRHVGAELARLRQTDHRIQVGPVEIDLPARAMDKVADVGDAILEHSMRRRVGDHQCAEVVAVLVDLGSQVVDVDVAPFVARDDHDLEARHDRARRVGAVGRGRDEAHSALEITATAVIGANCEEPCVLALRARVRLQRNRVIAGDRAQPFLEIREQLQIARCLVDGCERVDRRELGPADRRHLRRCVELHRARAERDHRPVERDVAIAQVPQVTEHRRLGVMRMEDLVDQVRSGARERRRNRVGGRGGERVSMPNAPSTASR